MADQSTGWHGHRAPYQDEKGTWWTYDPEKYDWIEAPPAPAEHQGKVVLTGEAKTQALRAQRGMPPAVSAHLPGWEPTIPDRPAEPPAMTQEEKEQLDPWVAMVMMLHGGNADGDDHGGDDEQAPIILMTMVMMMLMMLSDDHGGDVEHEYTDGDDN